MSRIADAKLVFGQSIEDELDALAADLRGLIARTREAARDCRGLNDLAASLNGLASTMEHATVQIEDTRQEARRWLGIDREPIHERTNAALLNEIREVAA